MSSDGGVDGARERPALEVLMILADSAQVADGKLFVLGGGIQVVGPRAKPMSVALLISVPWDRANVSHDWRLELLDEDGAPVSHNGQEIAVQGKFEAGRPPGRLPGTPLQVPMAIAFNTMPVAPGKRYTWRLSIDDTTDPRWQASFGVRPAKA